MPVNCQTTVNVNLQLSFTCLLGPPSVCQKPGITKIGCENCMRFTQRTLRPQCRSRRSKQASDDDDKFGLSHCRRPLHRGRSIGFDFGGTQFDDCKRKFNKSCKFCQRNMSNKFCLQTSLKFSEKVLK